MVPRGSDSLAGLCRPAIDTIGWVG